MASNGPVEIETTCITIQETTEEIQARARRLEYRRGLSKFGQVRAGIEDGNTMVVEFGVSLHWMDESATNETAVQAATPVVASKKGTPRYGKISSGNVSGKVRYVIPSQRNHKHSYRPPPDDAPSTLTEKGKILKLIEYCQEKIPPESTGGKKKKKKKKQKLSHPMEVMNVFMEVGVAPPKTTNDLKKKIEVLSALITEENI